MALTVYLVEDWPLQPRLAEALTERGAVVVGGSYSLAEALKDVAVLKPYVVITEVQLSVGSGLQLLRELRDTAQPPDQWRIVLTHYCNSYFRDAAARAGATHFYDKQWEIGHMLDIIEQRQRAAEGKTDVARDRTNATGHERGPEPSDGTEA